MNRPIPIDTPDNTATDNTRLNMWLILLEALAALLILIAIVWWTMFSGRRGGEPPSQDGEDGESPR